MRKTLSTIAPALVVSAILLTGCGSDDEDKKGTDNPFGGSSTSASPAPTAESTEGTVEPVEPTEDVPTEDVPTEDVPTEDVPTEEPGSGDGTISGLPLSDYAEQAEEMSKKQVMDLGVYSGYDVKAEGEALVYEYTFKTALPAKPDQATIDQASKSMESLSNTLIDQMKAGGMTNPSIEYRYFNPDGSEIYTVKFP